jgi:hypothetical protein
VVLLSGPDPFQRLRPLNPFCSFYPPSPTPPATGPAARVALEHPDWLASKVMQKALSPRPSTTRAVAAGQDDIAAHISAYSPRVAKHLNNFQDTSVPCRA